MCLFIIIHGLLYFLLLFSCPRCSSRQSPIFIYIRFYKFIIVCMGNLLTTTYSVLSNGYLYNFIVLCFSFVFAHFLSKPFYFIYYYLYSSFPLKLPVLAAAPDITTFIGLLVIYHFNL